MEGHKLSLSERNLYRKIFELKEEGNGPCNFLTQSSGNIVRAIKSINKMHMRHVACRRCEIHAESYLRNPKGREEPEDLCFRCDDNIKTEHNEILLEGVGCIHMMQDSPPLSGSFEHSN